MAGNSFGDLFRITTFGESHGKAIGCVIDGCPPLLELNEYDIQNELDKRKPNKTIASTGREEEDKVEILSGVFDGKTTGCPICLLIYNKDYRSEDYNDIKDIFRPSHADFTYFMKYGIRDYRGGGRSSARETACRVAGGAIAKKYLNTKLGIDIMAYTNSIGNIKININCLDITHNMIDNNVIKCPDIGQSKKMLELINVISKQGNSIGGSVKCIVKNCPIGIGEPVFDKLSSKLAYAMMSINATKAFEIGEGINSSMITGEENNDDFFYENEKVITKTNHSGGILGGISNGQNIDFTTYFKPIATIKKEQKTINTDFKNTTIQMKKGRHDVCCVPRAVPVVEAMTAFVIMDLYLINNSFH